MIAYLDGDPHEVRAGALVRELLSGDARAAVAAGAAVVLDAWGHVVGLEGALADGGSYILVTRGSKPPSVQACLEARAPGGLPADFAKHLIRRAIARARAAGGGASPRGIAALAGALVARHDADAVWSYLAGDERAVAVKAVGQARVRDYMPALSAVVVATRDLLTLAHGETVFDYFAECRIVEVGTTNKAKASDYERALTGADALAVCRRADFAIAGFTVGAELEELAALAKRAGKPLVVILGGEGLMDSSGAPRPSIGDLTIIAGPAEIPDIDVAFLTREYSIAGPADDGVRRREVAAVLWNSLQKE